MKKCLASFWAALALTSFAALIVFFRTEDWLWFLAVPIVKVLITWGEDDD